MLSLEYTHVGVLAPRPTLANSLAVETILKRDQEAQDFRAPYQTNSPFSIEGTAPCMATPQRVASVRDLS